MLKEPWNKNEKLQKHHKLEFAATHKVRDGDFWKHVLWSDKTKMELFDHTGQASEHHLSKIRELQRENALNACFRVNFVVFSSWVIYSSLISYLDSCWSMWGKGRALWMWAWLRPGDLSTPASTTLSWRSQMLGRSVTLPWGWHAG